MFFRKKTAVCPAKVLFEILDRDLQDGLCTHILFSADGKKHSFGAWGDGGETGRNVTFYLDRSEYRSRRELEENASVGGSLLAGSDMPVTVTECNGCTPDSEPMLKPYIRK